MLWRSGCHLSKSVHMQNSLVMATTWLITSVQDGGNDHEFNPTDCASNVMNKDGKEDFLLILLHGRLGTDSQSGKTIDLKANISGRTAQSIPKRWLIRCDCVYFSRPMAAKKWLWQVVHANKAGFGWAGLLI